MHCIPVSCRAEAVQLLEVGAVLGTAAAIERELDVAPGDAAVAGIDGDEDVDRA